MLQERQIKENLSWPEGQRIAVMLSFDFQGGEDLPPNKNGIMNHEEWTQAEYGSRTGKRPVGWRSCTQSPNSIELLMESGYLWNSNSFSYDLPFLWDHEKRTLVELPRQPFGDGRAYGHGDSGNPNDALMIWKGMFDEFYEESKFGPAFCPFQFHPFISSRPGRARALKEIIQYMKKHEGAWFAKGSEVAELALKFGSAAKKPMLKEAVGS